MLPLPGQTGDPVYVNPTNVLYVRPGSPDNATLYFGDDRTLTVGLPIGAVVAALDKAMSD
jgi:hypothetical protein